MELIIGYFTMISVGAFFMMYVDKKKAIARKYRISEKKLWIAALAGGSAGSLAGMWMFRHKTRHSLFKYGMPLLVVFHLVCLYRLLWVI